MKKFFSKLITIFFVILTFNNIQKIEAGEIISDIVKETIESTTEDISKELVKELTQELSEETAKEILRTIGEDLSKEVGESTLKILGESGAKEITEEIAAQISKAAADTLISKTAEKLGITISENAARSAAEGVGNILKKELAKSLERIGKEEFEEMLKSASKAIAPEGASKLSKEVAERIGRKTEEDVAKKLTKTQKFFAFIKNHIGFTLLAAVVFSVPNYITGPIEDKAAFDAEQWALKAPQPFGILTLKIPDWLFKKIGRYGEQHSGFFVYESLKNKKQQNTSNYFITAGSSDYSDCGPSWNKEDLTSKYFGGRMIHLNTGLEFFASGDPINSKFPMRRFIGTRDPNSKCEDSLSTIENYLGLLTTNMKAGTPATKEFRRSGYTTQQKGGIAIDISNIDNFVKKIMSPENPAFESLLNKEYTIGGYKVTPATVNKKSEKKNEITIIYEGKYPAIAVGVNLYKTNDTKYAQQIGEPDYILPISQGTRGRLESIPAIIPQMQKDGNVKWTVTDQPFPYLCSIFGQEDEGESKVFCYSTSNPAGSDPVAKIKQADIDEIISLDSDLKEQIDQLRENYKSGKIPGKKDDKQKSETNIFKRGEFTLEKVPVNKENIYIYKLDPTNNAKIKEKILGGSGAIDYIIPINEQFNHVSISSPDVKYLASLVTSTFYDDKLLITEIATPNTNLPGTYYQEYQVNPNIKEEMTLYSTLLETLFQKFNSKINPTFATLIAKLLTEYLIQNNLDQIIKDKNLNNTKLKDALDNLANNILNEIENNQQYTDANQQTKLEIISQVIQQQSFETISLENFKDITIENLKSDTYSTNYLNWLENEGITAFPKLYVYASLAILNNNTASIKQELNSRAFETELDKAHTNWIKSLALDKSNWEKYNVIGSFKFTYDVPIIPTSLQDIKDNYFVYVSQKFPNNYFIVSDTLQPNQSEKFINQKYLISLVTGFVYENIDGQLQQKMSGDNPTIINTSSTLNTLNQSLKDKISKIETINSNFGAFKLAIDLKDLKAGPYIYQQINNIGDFDNWSKLPRSERLKQINAFFVASKFIDNSAFTFGENESEWDRSEIRCNKLSVLDSDELLNLPKNILPNSHDSKINNYIIINLTNGKAITTQSCLMESKADPEKMLNKLQNIPSDIKSRIQDIIQQREVEQAPEIKKETIIKMDSDIVNKLLSTEIDYLEKPYETLKEYGNKYYRIFGNVIIDFMIDKNKGAIFNEEGKSTRILTGDLLENTRKAFGASIDDNGKEILGIPAKLSQISITETAKEVGNTTINNTTLKFKTFEAPLFAKDFQEGGPIADYILISTKSPDTQYYIDPLSEDLISNTGKIEAATYPVYQNNQTLMAITGNKYPSKRIFAGAEIGAFTFDNTENNNGPWEVYGPDDKQFMILQNQKSKTKFLGIKMDSAVANSVDITNNIMYKFGDNNIVKKTETNTATKIDKKLRLYDYIGTQSTGEEFDINTRQIEDGEDSPLALLGTLTDNNWQTDSIYLYIDSKYVNAKKISETLFKTDDKKYEINILGEKMDPTTNGQYFAIKVKTPDAKEKIYFYIPKYDKVAPILLNKLKEKVGYVVKNTLYGGYDLFKPFNINKLEALEEQDQIKKYTPFMSEFKKSCKKCSGNEGKAEYVSAALTGPYPRYLYEYNIYKDSDKDYYIDGASFINLDTGILYDSTGKPTEEALTKETFNLLLREKDIKIPAPENEIE